MNLTKLCWIIVLTNLLLPKTTFAQTEPEEDLSDFETWSSIGLEYKPIKKLSFELEEQLRLKQNSSAVDVYFTELSTKYEIIKNLKIGGGMRFIRSNDNQGKIQGYENLLRYHFDVNYENEISRLSLKHRIRYQHKKELIEGADSDERLRFKSELSYNFPNWKLDPSLSGELFSNQEVFEKNNLEKYRITLSTDYKIKNAGQIGLFLRHEKGLNQTFPKSTNILGFAYKYTIKGK